MDSGKKNDSIYRIVFDQIDADGDGKLSKAEFKAVCKKKLPPEDHKLLKNKKYIDFDKLFGKVATIDFDTFKERLEEQGGSPVLNKLVAFETQKKHGYHTQEKYGYSSYRVYSLQYGQPTGCPRLSWNKWMEWPRPQATRVWPPTTPISPEICCRFGTFKLEFFIRSNDQEEWNLKIPYTHIDAQTMRVISDPKSVGRDEAYVKLIMEVGECEGTLLSRDGRNTFMNDTINGVPTTNESAILKTDIEISCLQDLLIELKLDKGSEHGANATEIQSHSEWIPRRCYGEKCQYWIGVMKFLWNVVVVTISIYNLYASVNVFREVVDAQLKSLYVLLDSLMDRFLGIVYSETIQNIIAPIQMSLSRFVAGASDLFFHFGSPILNIFYRLWPILTAFCIPIGRAMHQIWAVFSQCGKSILTSCAPMWRLLCQMWDKCAGSFQRLVGCFRQGGKSILTLCDKGRVHVQKCAECGCFQKCARVWNVLCQMCGKGWVHVQKCAECGCFQKCTGLYQKLLSCFQNCAGYGIKYKGTQSRASSVQKGVCDLKNLIQKTCCKQCNLICQRKKTPRDMNMDHTEELQKQEKKKKQ